jgi:transposase
VSAAHLAAWAGIARATTRARGKQRHGKTRKGNVHLKTALVTAAVAAAKKRGTYLKDKYHRLTLAAARCARPSRSGTKS